MISLGCFNFIIFTTYQMSEKYEYAQKIPTSIKIITRQYIFYRPDNRCLIFYDTSRNKKICEKWTMNIDKKFDQKNYLTALDIFHEKKIWNVLSPPYLYIYFHK